VDSCCAFASHAFAPSGPSSFSKLRSLTPGMPATRYRLPLPQRSVLLFFPVAGSGFLVIHRSSMYPGMRAPVRSDLTHGLRTVIDDLTAVQLEPAPAAEEIGDDGVERGGELLGVLVRVDVHAEDAFVFGQDGALRES